MDAGDPAGDEVGLGGAALRREREATLRRGALLLGLACAGVPIALVDAAYGVSDRLVAAFTLGEAPTIDPLALVAIAWFILVGAGALWCARVDPWARRWLGPSALTLLILAIWRLGGSPAVFTAFALGVVGVIYLRDVDAG